MGATDGATQDKPAVQRRLARQEKTEQDTDDDIKPSKCGTMRPGIGGVLPVGQAVPNGFAESAPFFFNINMGQHQHAIFFNINMRSSTI